MKRYRVKKVVKYVLCAIGFILFVIVLLGQTNLGNLPADQNSEKSFITIGNEEIRFTQKGNGKDI